MNSYEAVLEWGYAHINDGVTFKEFEEFVASRQLNLNEPRRWALFREFFQSLEKGDQTKSAKHAAMREGDKTFHLTAEAAFKHLEHVELLDARQSAKTAMWFAIASLVLAATVGAAQIWLAARPMLG